MALNSVVYRSLCRVVGGQDPSALDDCVAAGRLQALYEMAYTHDVVPALAVRCNQHDIDSDLLRDDSADELKQALMDNTRRNMNICAQALKITRQLNQAGILPLFLKGTARLLMGQSQHLGFRKQVDIDVLVEPAQIATARDIFLAEGYHYQVHGADPSALQQVAVDTPKALQLSAAHHHLPLLIKKDYGTTVELHRHYLPARFQRNNPLEPLFASALQVDSQGAHFLVPSAEYQLVHLILGKLVNDGFFARRSFSIREACDLIDLLDNAGENLDMRILEKQCGAQFALFHTLVAELMAYRSPLTISASPKASSYLWMMNKRLDSILACRLLDAVARIDYLSHQLAYSPAKFPNYVKRRIPM